MPLTPGTRLGVYEITAPLGEGGMGQVAIKILLWRGESLANPGGKVRSRRFR